MADNEESSDLSKVDESKSIVVDTIDEDDENTQKGDFHDLHDSFS